MQSDKWQPPCDGRLEAKIRTRFKAMEQDIDLSYTRNQCPHLHFEIMSTNLGDRDAKIFHKKRGLCGILRDGHGVQR
jgi:hypothetical protein